jgi:DNA-binding NarL/FixJ family response regulator
MAKGGEAGSLLDLLSDREIQVLRALALGKSNREIAEAYYISTKTVDTHRSRLLKKLDLRNNAELTRFAIRNRIVEP